MEIDLTPALRRCLFDNAYFHQRWRGGQAGRTYDQLPEATKGCGSDTGHQTMASEAIQLSNRPISDVVSGGIV